MALFPLAAQEFQVLARYNALLKAAFDAERVELLHSDSIHEVFKVNEIRQETEADEEGPEEKNNPALKPRSNKAVVVTPGGSRGWSCCVVINKTKLY